MSTADIGYLLNRVTRHLRLAYAAELVDLGLRPQQAAVLMAIHRSPKGELAPRQAGQSIDADPATTSGVIDRLARDGWIASRPHPQDGRSRLLSLTPRAQEIIHQVIGAAERVSDAATAPLTAHERNILTHLLTKMCECDEPSSPQEAASR